jgi:hypothetical protein
LNLRENGFFFSKSVISRENFIVDVNSRVLYFSVIQSAFARGVVSELSFPGSGKSNLRENGFFFNICLFVGEFSSGR